MTRNSEPSRGPIVTLDGPAGSGKTTTARELARRLGFRHLDSGALYRALTYALLQEGIPREEWSALSSVDLEALGISAEAGDGRVDIHWRGRSLTEELRTPEVTKRVAFVASLPAVRGWLMGVQHLLGGRGHLVADGRDMGTVVFPDADVKVFLVADLEARARRRLLQAQEAAPTPEQIVAEAARIRERDRTDRGRELSPLRRPQDALEIDTTSLTFEEQVTLILKRVKHLTGPMGLG